MMMENRKARKGTHVPQSPQKCLFTVFPDAVSLSSKIFGVPSMPTSLVGIGKLTENLHYHKQCTTLPGFIHFPESSDGKEIGKGGIKGNERMKRENTRN